MQYYKINSSALLISFNLTEVCLKKDVLNPSKCSKIMKGRKGNWNPLKLCYYPSFSEWNGTSPWKAIRFSRPNDWSLSIHEFAHGSQTKGKNY